MEFIAQEPDPAVVDDFILISVKTGDDRWHLTLQWWTVQRGWKLDPHVIKRITGHTLTYVLRNNIHTNITWISHTTELIKAIINRYALTRIKESSNSASNPVRKLCSGSKLSTQIIMSIYSTWLGRPAHRRIFWIFRFKICCLQIFSLNHQISGVKNNKIMLSSYLHILKTRSSVLKNPQNCPIFSLQENTLKAP